MKVDVLLVYGLKGQLFSALALVWVRHLCWGKDKFEITSKKTVNDAINPNVCP